MAKEWTDEEVQSEIAKAVQIVREDHFDAFLRSRMSPSNPNPPSGNDPPAPSGNPNPPDPNQPKPKKGIWWGEELSS